ncbi:MAG TPA: VWA domain-containing protein [Pyrinomonadaceae bacterium]|nr:VWA domain-containing protein [Pyrinomonadaceae bacterium]
MSCSKKREKHLWPALLIGALALFFWTGALQAQSLKDLPPPPPAPTPKPTPTPRPLTDEDFDIVRVSSNLVMVPVSVVDSGGEPVHGLQANDFRIEEEGRLQQIAQIGDPDQVPLDIALLFDISSSVSQKGFFEFQQTAAASFLRLVLKPVDRAAIFTIADRALLVQPLAPAQTAAARLLTIPAATTPVPTAFYDTVVAASQYLLENSNEGRRRVIVVISDGDDNFSNKVRDLTIAEVRASQDGTLTPATVRQNLQLRHRQAVVETQRGVQQADISFYSINPGGTSVRLNEISQRAQTAMQSIAEATGGTAFVPNSEKDLERVFSEIASELRGQYLLQYYSNSESPAGQFRRIKVSTPTRQELRVRARQGYYPKGKA